MAKINFFLKDKNKSKTSIEAIVRFKGERFKVQTGFSVATEYWNAGTHRCSITQEYEEGLFLNKELEKIEVKLKKQFLEYLLKNIVPTQDQFKRDYNEDKKENVFLTSLIKNHVENSEYSRQTRNKYGTLLYWIELFEKDKKVRFMASDIDLGWYSRFKSFFNSQTYEKKVNGSKEPEIHHYTLNYFGSIIKCLKVVLKNVGEEIDVKKDILDKKFKTEDEISENIYLSEQELKLIIDFVPTPENIKGIMNDDRIQNVSEKIRSLLLVKNRFLIGCYTALRVSDFKRIERVNVKEGFLRIKPVKGKKLNSDIVIPIHPVVKAILNSGFDMNSKVSEQKINEHIKEICRLVGINELVSITKTEGGKQVERVYPKWQLVTTHTARRSGATNMFKAGIPSISIMKITGHKTEKNFLKYIKISAEENALLLAGHPFFKIK